MNSIQFSVCMHISFLSALWLHYEILTNPSIRSTMFNNSRGSRGISIMEALERVCLCVPFWECVLDDYDHYSNSFALKYRMREWRNERRMRSLTRIKTKKLKIEPMITIKKQLKLEPKIKKRRSFRRLRGYT